jgi:hypothetical protein
MVFMRKWFMAPAELFQDSASLMPTGSGTAVLIIF